MHDLLVILLTIIFLPVVIFLVSFVYHLTIKSRIISKAAHQLSSMSQTGETSVTPRGLTFLEIKKIADLYVEYLLTEFSLWQVSLIPGKSSQETLDEAEMNANSSWITFQNYLVEVNFDDQKMKYEISSQISQAIFDQSESDFLFVYPFIPKESDSEESVFKEVMEMEKRRTMPTEQFLIDCLLDMTLEIYSATKSRRREKIPAKAFRRVNL